MSFPFKIASGACTKPFKLLLEYVLQDWDRKSPHRHMLRQTTGFLTHFGRKTLPAILSTVQQLDSSQARFRRRQQEQRFGVQAESAMQAGNAKASRRRPELWVKENRPVNLIVLGPIQLPETEAAVKELSSLANIQARGLPPDAFQHMTEEDWEQSEVLFVLAVRGPPVEEVVQNAKNLKWVHCHCTGVNHMLAPSIVKEDIALTNRKDCFSHALAEFALFSCNYFAKDLPRLLRSKKDRKWDVFAVQELRGSTMGIIGLGDIGRATASIAKAFKMKVIGLRRNTTLTPEEEQIVDEVYGPEDLQKVMGMSDYVVAALPETKNTFEMINAKAIDAMQPHAVFINVGRGKTVEEPALIKALEERRIKGAALDVFQHEPLSSESAFYDLDNVLVSSHTAFRTGTDRTDSVWAFNKLLKEYIAGEELRNLVDAKEGY